ncbi:MAG: HmuY family protein [Chitinophagaceae bacterium]
MFLFSCEKKDKAITLPPKGDGTVMQVDMGEDYKFQYFINLDEERIVHISDNSTWDLAFSCKSNEHSIFLNASKYGAAISINKKNFSDVNAQDTMGLASRWKIDRPSGMIDSSAIGNWKGNDNIYLIRLDKEGKKIRKLKIVYEDMFQYIIHVGDLFSTSGTDITILKKANNNYAYFSFDFLNTVDDIEPADNTSWDVQATLYSLYFYDQNPALPYLVNGFLLNPNNTFAAKDSTLSFNDINEQQIPNFVLTQHNDAIGYDWKKYDIDKNVYTVDNRYNFLIKTQHDAYIKLRFLDFYSASGIKGSPKFEIKRIK